MRMNKTSRLLAVLLALLLALGSAPAALADGLVISSEQYAELSDAAVQEFYDRLMATTTLEEFDAVSYELNDEQIVAFFDKLSVEQQTALDAKANALIAEYEAATDVPAEEIEEEVVDEREIVYPTVNYTNVAPFKAPVVGTAQTRMMLLAASEEETDNGLETRKSVSGPDTNGRYTLTLEAWATGAKVITEQVTNVPTDIILVLDQSGSMDQNFSSTTSATYTKYDSSTQASTLYSNRSSLYVKRSDGSYAPVTVSRDSVQTGGSYSAYTNESNSTYYENRSDLYHLCPSETYGKITVTRTGSDNSRTYTYTCENCGSLGTSTGRNTQPDFSSDFYQYSSSGTTYQYTFTYTDVNGTTQTATALASESVSDWELYRQQTSTTTTTKLAALKNAVSNFAASVATKAKGADGILDNEDDVDHTISVVGFASGSSWNGTNYNYGNTEVFVGGTQYRYGSNASAQYTNVPQDMSTTAGVNNVTASINALDADGGTIINLGMEMAADILEANPVPSGEKRNRVVVVFTDGIPGWSGYDSDVADDAMDQSDIIKSTYGATVYTVGIFSGADATSAGSSSGNDTQKANYFMQRLSSNTSYPQTPSYYLSASDANALNAIFQQISENIESGGSSITLDESAVVRDVLSDQFVLPEGTEISDIKLYTAEYVDGTFEAREDWESIEATADTVSISGKTIEVTGFDFAENWVGTEKDSDGNVTAYHGKKLIIEIPIVVRDGFLGGNGVLTNAEGSGVYEDASAKEALDEFVSPSVNVPISEQSITVADKNVYLLGSLTVDQLLAGHTITYIDSNGNTVTEDTVFEGYDAYIEVTVDGDNKTNLIGDTTYKANLTISPKPTEETGSVGEAATDQTTEASGNIYVFKPVLTFNDSKEKYLEVMTEADADTYYERNNLVSEVWKNGDTLSTATGVTMTGTKPTLALTYTPSYAEGDTALFDSTMKVVAKNDVRVNVTVAIGTTDVTAHTTSIRNACVCTELDTPCEHKTDVTAEAMGNNPEFVVHVYDVYGHLAITKTVEGNPATGVATNFTFAVELKDKDGNALTVKKYTIGETEYEFNGTVTLANGQTATISDLPPEATYTVTETVPAGYVSSANTVTGSIIAGSTMTATFTNTYTTGSLTVSKTVVGEDAPADDEFEFTVTLDPAISGTFNGVEFQNGVATITLKGDESKTIDGLPINATYTVTEKEYADYTTTMTGDKGTIDADGETAAFTNTYQYGSLTITKAFSNCTPQAGETFLFKVTGSNNFAMDVVIVGAGSITIEHLPLGTYTVTEDNAWSWRYTSDPASASDEITATENGSVTFTNTLSENKWLDGNAYAENNFSGKESN